VTDQDISPLLAERVQSACHQGTALTIVGSGSKAFLGGQQSADSASGTTDHGADVLDLVPHCGILDYEPAELVLTARAGTPLAEIKQILSASGQMLPFDPPQFGGKGTLGGAIASGLSGPARPWQGAVRDAVLGVTLINGQGEILKFGGQVMKNVAGYDVSRLMAGAFGTLGVLLEISIRVMPLPRVHQTQVVATTTEQALRWFAEWNQTALPITAASFHDGQLHVRLAGAQSAVHKAALRIGGDTLAEATASTYWQALRDHQLEFFQPGEPDLWRTVVPLTAPVEALPDAPQLFDWGGQQRWFRLPSGREADIRPQTTAAGGHATLFRPSAQATGARQVSPFTPLPAPLHALHQRIKIALDPKGIFNAGRLFTEL